MILSSDCLADLTGPTIGVQFKNVMVADEYFSPDTVIVTPGQRVMWQWVGMEQHNVTWVTGSGAVTDNSVTQVTGDHVRYFDTFGTYVYQCTIHPDMIGLVKVVPNVVAELPLCATNCPGSP